MSVPEPLLVRRNNFAEMAVTTDDDENVVLTLGRPDCHGGPDEFLLTVGDVVSLIDRLVGKLAEVKGLARPEPGAGPLSSTF